MIPAKRNPPEAEVHGNSFTRNCFCGAAAASRFQMRRASLLFANRRAARVDPLRSLLKYPCTPRESALGRMARRERRAYPQRSVRSEQRRQTPQSALASPTHQLPLFPSASSALRVAPLFGLACVARRSQIHWGYAPSSRLAQAKNQSATRHAWVFQQTPMVASLPRAGSGRDGAGRRWDTDRGLRRFARCRCRFR